MAEKEEFDLADFLTDSLSLQINVTTPTRNMFPFTPEDPYLDLINSDPLELLGEKSFKKCQQIPEDVIGTPIQEFFRGANIFITGGTGFIGKTITEKLIRSIPHIGHIYLLIRSKRGKTSKERFDHLMEDHLFQRVKAEVPNFRSKVSVVDGDISEIDLGLSPADHQLLVETVHVVFHSAADVRFTETLKSAVSSNVLGSKHVMDLAKQITNLKSYVHVSTAYSHCVRRHIWEKDYKINVNHQELLDYIETKTEEELIEETPRLMQGWPNTYTFTKALCENMVVETREHLPLCIFRPSVVVNTYKEPVRGWTDNMYGPVGILVGAGHGVLHCAILGYEIGLDIVPVDYVINCMVAAAWKTGTCRDNLTVPFYNYTATSLNPMIWKTVVKYALTIKGVFPFHRSIWYTSFFSTESYFVNGTVYWLLHRIPGFFFDKLSELSGEKPRLTKLYKLLHVLEEHTGYFSLRSWVFETDNVMSLWDSLGEKEKQIFYFDIRDIDWKELFLVSKLGLRYYYLKEPMENLQAAVRKNKWLKWLHNSAKILFGLAALKLLAATARILPI